MFPKPIKLKFEKVHTHTHTIPTPSQASKKLLTLSPRCSQSQLNSSLKRYIPTLSHHPYTFTSQQEIADTVTKMFPKPIKLKFEKVNTHTLTIPIPSQASKKLLTLSPRCSQSQLNSNLKRYIPTLTLSPHLHRPARNC